MAVIAGYDGGVDWGLIVDSDVAGYSTHSWSVDVTGEAHDITDFNSSGWRTFLAGLKGWSGSVELFVDGTTHCSPSDVGSSATLKLSLNSSNYLSGTAICTGWHPTASVDGVETQSLDFQGTGTLAYT